ncbi:hypothetical protein AEAC466_17115 [Asticcacaulis sp. AC466]|uniref:type II toxin-antitoxin system RelE/ParE family toxin n=1 Tax=Asticcacaulis sp. AC466 TaxID=1282362 RepID=UPI0003C3FA10|nr:type II toxin-antitoxin system RelE/ParE family toxin [Asticcacaulis sp. AC466]ESQ82587.1 hypothetical protein AEAC466_17115 [Asticcacaulis sp. AC466]
MRVSLSAQAETSLEQIGDYIAQDSPRQAMIFIRKLRKAALALGNHPKAYPLIPRYEKYGHRRKPYGSYVIIYTVDGDHVVIDAILHSAQDYEILLFPNA